MSQEFHENNSDEQELHPHTSTDNILIGELMTLLGGCTFHIDESTQTIVIETYSKGDDKVIHLPNLLNDEDVKEILDVIAGRTNSISLLNMSNHALRQIAREFISDPYETFEPIRKDVKKRPEGVQIAYEGKSRGRKYRNKRERNRQKSGRVLKKLANDGIYLNFEQ